MATDLAANEVELGFDPGRVCFGLSRIGYTPASAICDIIDNSVRAIENSPDLKKKSIRVIIVKDRNDFSDSRKNNVKEYLIIDNGHGMNEQSMKGALKLGSSDSEYEDHSLSKFGLGLKSAAFSQGDELHLISSTGDSQFRKFVVSLPDIQEKQRYFAKELPLSDEDVEIIRTYLPEGHGTVVRIGKVRLVNHPSIKKTVEELKRRIGVK